MSPTIKVTAPMLIAQIGTLLGFACYGVFLTTLQQEWQLLHVESGLIASAFFLGYMLFVPFATVLTDRIDARQIFILGGFLAIIGLLGMGFIAEGFFSASFFMAIQGAGLAGTYMPGLKILSDRIQSGEVTRHISFYTAFFWLRYRAILFNIRSASACLWLAQCFHSHCFRALCFCMYRSFLYSTNKKTFLS